MWMKESVILQKADPLPLTIQQQLFPELQEPLVMLHQERRVIPADCLCAAEEEERAEHLIGLSVFQITYKSQFLHHVTILPFSNTAAAATNFRGK